VIDGVIYAHANACDDFGEPDYFDEVCGTAVPMTLHAHAHQICFA